LLELLICLSTHMTIYQCPMHPEITSDKSGNCPKCGMEMIPLENKKEEAYRKDHERRKESVRKADDLHSRHSIEGLLKMTWQEKFKMSMTMTMGMDHKGLAGREMARFMEEDIRRKFYFALIFTIPITAYSPLGEKIFGIDMPSPIPVQWILFIFTTPVFFYSGWIFLYSSYKALQSRILNMAVLIAISITAAYLFSLVLTLTGSNDSFYEAAAMLVTFVLFGHWMEMKSRRGTTDTLAALFALIPAQARVERNGKEESIPTSEVKAGDIVLLKPGDKVAVDGEIIEGETTIDESLVTGESLPVSKTVGNKVTGGSINQFGSIKFRAVRVGGDTVLSRIVKLVETAQNSKAPGQKLADKFSVYLIFLAAGGGLITFIVWYFVMDESVIFALTFAISTVVIACPDALGLATPTAVAVGTGLGAKHNILIKDASTLEQVSKIQAIIFDKTGTLTEGKPKVTDMAVLEGFAVDELLKLTASAEAKSGHPLGNAILDEAEKRKISVSTSVRKFSAISGHGVEASVDGKVIVAGTVKLMKDKNIDISHLKDMINGYLNAGKTLVIVAIDGRASGVIAIADTLRMTSKIAVEKLKGLGIEVAILTGDNKKTAEAIGRQLGIDRIFAEVLPEEKSAYIKKLQAENKFTAMVGDGINDAPALAQADIGIAIGAGTDVAVETANVVLMKSDPADVLRAIRLSKATVVKMKQNLFWASIYNILAVPIAAGILYPKFGIILRPEIAALLMSISSIIVAVNAIMLKRVEKQLIEI